MKKAVFHQRSDSTLSEKLWKNLNGLHDGFLLAVLAVVILISGYCLYDNWYVWAMRLMQTCCATNRILPIRQTIHLLPREW